MEAQETIYKKWKVYVKQYANLQDSIKQGVQRGDSELLAYSLSGAFVGADSLSRPVVSPEWQPWELTQLSTLLERKSNSLLMRHESDAFFREDHGVSFLYPIFKSSFLAFLVSFHSNALYLARFGRGGGMSLSMKHVPFAALGVVSGFAHEGEQYLRLLVKAYNRSSLLYAEYPIFCFILALASQYFGEPMERLKGEAAEETLFSELLGVWNSSDLDRVRELCLAVCNFHTHRCKPDKGNQWYEFSNGYWSAWPIEINFLFKLRELSGLANPELNHPLMNTPLGCLPVGVPVALDELSMRVYERMKAQGFDLQAVYEKLYFERF